MLLLAKSLIRESVISIVIIISTNLIMINLNLTTFKLLLVITLYLLKISKISQKMKNRMTLIRATEELLIDRLIRRLIDK